MPSELFHGAVRAWFDGRFDGPTEPQARAWPLIRARRSTLIAAPTGSGKTLAAFLSAIDDLVRQAGKGGLDDRTQVVYVSPLKALTNDIQRNLQEPLAGIGEELARSGAPPAGIRTLVRTGDTTAAQRAAMVKRPPHIVVTTPESLYILLTSEGGRAMLRTARTLIVDEIHALVGDKRGSHLSLSIERLRALVGAPLVRIGLSATQKPIEEVARFLVGTDGGQACEIVDAGHYREIDLAIELPGSPLETVMSAEVWKEVHDRLATLILAHRSTLVFVNTRRLAERLTRHLTERLGEGAVATHHGSLSREQRLASEQRLKAGELRALVATASLELGIDVGAVDLVCQVGSTRSIATLLQRVGRSGHSIGGRPKGRLFPLSRDELVECAAAIDAARRGELDRVTIPGKPLDILAQQIVAAVACEEWTEQALFDTVRRAWPYRALGREEFDAVVRMLSEGFSTRRGRRAALIHRDAVNGKLRARRGSRLAAVTSGGAIPDTADYEVRLEPAGTLVGTINEDFAIESIPGDIFQLGNTSWRIVRIETGRVRVEDARGQPPNIPFWFGEAPARTEELSAAVSRLREEVDRRLGGAGDGAGREAAVAWLAEAAGVGRAGAEQIADYLAAARGALGVMPTQQTLVLERFFDEAGGMQLVVHAPFGGRVNRAWGLALRKRFCRKFNFELQAAANENAIVLSLGPTHSFPLDDVFGYLRSESVRDVLVQALLDAPMFAIRWRWNAARALAILRWRGGRKVAPQLQRIQAEDLISVVFPDQLACAENIAGAREIPDHPLVGQTIRDCLEEAMDIDALESLLRSIERGERRCVTRDLTEPSPLAGEILNAKPYAFLDDAPLEERRTQAVLSRRWLDPASADDLGTLDAAAIDRVRGEVWPQPASADELHEALVLLGFVTDDEGRTGRAVSPANAATGVDLEGWRGYLDELIAQKRAAVLRTGTGGPELWVAAERLDHLRAVFPDGALVPPIEPPGAAGRESGPPAGEETALVELLRGRLEGTGPATAAALAGLLGLPVAAVETALVALETEGFVLRGAFTPPASNTDSQASGAGSSDRQTRPVEWCARRLLARIHRYTINRLRKEIEPVEPAGFIRFLLDWQKVAPGAQETGPESLARIIEQLEGFEAPAAAWEGEILPARLEGYDPVWLDTLCLSGRVVWARLTPPRSAAAASASGADGGGDVGGGDATGEAGRKTARAAGPIRTTPVGLLPRARLPVWKTGGAGGNAGDLGVPARAVHEALVARGASFFDDLVAATGLLRSQVEEALGELAARGLVTSDSFTGLRALLTPPRRRRPPRGGRRRGSVALFGMESAGRWSLLPGPAAPDAPDEPDVVETVARSLLRRYGVIFRRLLDREGSLPPWRDLLRVTRRLEARGEIRGGRFVAGATGEQFALPEAVGALRAARRAPAAGTLVSVSAADPLNLVGILTPGGRISPVPANRVLYRDGTPIAVHEAGTTRFLVPLDTADEWPARNALLRRRVPPQLRAYLGRPA